MSENKEAYVFGIDLGTTYSVISCLQGTTVTVCPSSEGDNTVPSVVMYHGGDVIVGNPAKEQSLIYPDDTIQFVKSKIGLESEVEIGAGDGKMVKSPSEISSEILKKLAKDAGEYIGTEVKEVVITVPAYFGAREKEETKNAGELAGLEVLDIVEEPTAAAFYYGYEKSEEDEVVCVFDLGGGTFDVTALEKEGDAIKVITTEGDHDLGGKNWDAALIDRVKEKFIEQTGYSDEFDSDILQELQNKCEETKKRLSTAEKQSIPVKIDRQYSANIEITREEFDDITSVLLDSAIDLTKTVFERVEERGKKITKILLVGGSTLMPQVKRTLESEFDVQIVVNEPHLSVSKGACLYAGWKLAKNVIEEIKQVTKSEVDTDTGAGTDKVSIKKNEEEGVLEITTKDEKDGTERKFRIPSPLESKTFVTVATKSFAVLVLNENDEEILLNLVKKDTPLPYQGTMPVYTMSDGQTGVNTQLFQSEIYDDTYEPDYGVEIASAVLTGIPVGKPRGTEVVYHVNLSESGLMEITGESCGIDLDGKLELKYEEGIGQREE